MRKYEMPCGDDAEFEPGSGGLVLRNLRGITDPVEMDFIEAHALQVAQTNFFSTFQREHAFTLGDLLDMHRQWLGEVYPFAGQVRTINVSKGGFAFAAAEFLDSNLKTFEEQVLKRLTPCVVSSNATLSMAHVHGELIMLHPFREGNGRLTRWLINAMALQAGFPMLTYGFSRSKTRHEEYLAAVKLAVVGEHRPLADFFETCLVPHQD